MPDYLYRYISFESFVDLIQKQALTFVLPELWEDPKESAPFLNFLMGEQDGMVSSLLYAAHNKTYGQCWSKLDESDAMWRIYAYNNHAIQIRVSIEKLKLLPDVAIIPVEYTDSFNKIEAISREVAFLRSLAIKRTAFRHEEEVRLIKHYKFPDIYDAEKHVTALTAFVNAPNRMKLLDSLFPNKTIGEQINVLLRLLNEGKAKEKTIDVSFDAIPGFIDGVKVHPLAPEWFVETVGEYCKRNNVPFIGKSTLYARE